VLLGAGDSPTPKDERLVHFPAAPEGLIASVYDRAALGAGATLVGPAIVEQADSTVVLPLGWTAVGNASAELVLTRSAA
jgi:N-methylhydantoinase A